MAVDRRLPGALIGLGLAALALAGCAAPGQGDVHGSRARSHAVDIACQTGLPFVQGYDRLTLRFAPQIEAARLALNAAHDEAGSRVALERLATVLDSYDSALGALTAPASESGLVSSAVAAGAQMAQQARTLAGQAAGSRDVGAFDAAVQARTEAMRALSLQVTLLRSECQ